VTFSFIQISSPITVLLYQELVLSTLTLSTWYRYCTISTPIMSVARWLSDLFRENPPPRFRLMIMMITQPIIPFLPLRYRLIKFVIFLEYYGYDKVGERPRGHWNDDTNFCSTIGDNFMKFRLWSNLNIWQVILLGGVPPLVTIHILTNRAPRIRFESWTVFVKTFDFTAEPKWF